jgi:transcriptional regulator with XRE-family HTH domain
MTTGVDELLEQVRSKRQLPVPEVRRRIRLAAGVSVRELAKALGVSHTAVASWEPPEGRTPSRGLRDEYRRLLEELRRLAA